jgi:hypothetical protein
MDNLDIYLLILSAVISLKFTIEIFTISKSEQKTKEANRFFHEMSENKDMINNSRIQKIGLTVAKYKGEEKYRLIPQTKLVDLELA